MDRTCILTSTEMKLVTENGKDKPAVCVCVRANTNVYLPWQQTFREAADALCAEEADKGGSVKL